MPRINFNKNKHKTIQVPVGANLMESLLGVQIPVASSCNGDGVCAKCRIQILAGHVSKPNELEMELIKANGISGQTRISCQTQVISDITIDATYW
jgi:ferredoxin, 2Fe-2S